MGQNDTLSQDCEAVAAATAETVSLDVTNHLLISSGINDQVYIKFNWATGDTEVSASNFDLCLEAYGRWEFRKHECPSAPTLKNVRVICATLGSISFMGW
jgi:hypothetical protein